jgi:uncharacterized protein HemX
MKKNTFLSLFIITNIGFLFLQIRKQMLFIKESFRKQKHERTLTKLEQKNQEIEHAMHLAQNKQEIKQYAQEKLKMKPIRIAQLKKVNP